MTSQSFSHRFRHESGQTLIEVIIAAGLIVLVLTTLASGVAIGVKNSRIAKEQAQAKEYVRQSLEWIRNMRDQAGWETFYSISKPSPGIYCLDTLPTTYTEYNNWPASSQGCGTNYVLAGQYKREMTIEKSGNSTVTATVTVKWQDGGTTDLISKSSTTLYQWK